jgi:hypothetical protein
MPIQYDDTAGPTTERLAHAGAGTDHEFYDIGGKSKSSRRYTMRDDALGQALMRQNISGEEYSGLKKYALHWLAGGLQGHLGSVDLNRILAFDPGAMSGLAKTERQAEHKRLYWLAREHIGKRPGDVADLIACYDVPVPQVAHIFGYRSPYHGRVRVLEILSDAGYRLCKLWDDLAKGN